jgi:uncharacterized membrane protein YfcA
VADESASSTDERLSSIDESHLSIDEARSSVDEPHSSVDEARSSVDEAHSSVDNSRSSVDERELSPLFIGFMSTAAIILLVLLFFVTAAIGVVTGSNSLVTVPVMFQFGIPAKVAVATNMFGLTFMAIGATIPFLRQGKIEFKRLSPLVVLTLIGSALGAMLVGWISDKTIPVIVSVSMIVVTIFTFLKRDAGVKQAEKISTRSLIVAYALTFFLGIYGGLYSGGYVTILTAAFVAFLGMTFSEAVAGTKFVNVFSSGVATIVFMWQGLVNYRLGIILAVTMFIGAYIGAHFVTKLNDVWLKRIFLSTVLLLAIKTILDFTLK